MTGSYDDGRARSQGPRAAREGSGGNAPERPDRDERRFAAELFGHEFRDERYFD